MRVTFVIDRDGAVSAVCEERSPDKHAPFALEAVRTLAAGT
jgi:peroxiredoxin